MTGRADSSGGRRFFLTFTERSSQSRSHSTAPETNPEPSMSGPRRPKCAYCGGPMPPPALTGRPRSFCSAWCRQASEQDADKRARAERERQEQQRAAREQEVAEAARLRQKEREYQAALAEGGPSQPTPAGRGPSTRRSHGRGGGFVNGPRRSVVSSPASASVAKPMNGTSTAARMTGSSTSRTHVANVIEPPTGKDRTDDR